MKRILMSLCACATLAIGLSLGGCSASPDTVEGKNQIVSESNATLAQFRRSDTEIARQIDTAYGYAVFPTVTKGGAVVGGARGEGVAYQGGSAVGYCTLTQASIGAQLGGQQYSELILFENAAAMKKFQSGEYALSAQATAVAAASGSGANARYKEGVMVYTLGEQGLMYEASVGGQKFKYEPM